jgi:hypothetical protein
MRLKHAFASSIRDTSETYHTAARVGFKCTPLHLAPNRVSLSKYVQSWISSPVPENTAPGFFRRAGGEQQKFSQFEMKIEF